MKKQFPLPESTYWTVRAGSIAGEGAASSYKAQEIPEDAAKAILTHFGQGGGRKLRILDCMAGEGKYGIPISQYLQMHEFKPQVEFLDLTAEMLGKIPETPFPSKTRRADVRWRPLQNKQYDVIVLRYGLERLSRKQQLAFFRDALKSLRPGGIIVHTSMVSPESAKTFMRGYKIMKGDPEIKKGTTAHIPTHEEHLSLLEQAGFKSIKHAEAKTADGFYRSKVSTIGWWLNHQFGRLPERNEGERDEAYHQRARKANKPAEQTRRSIAKFFWLKSNAAAVRGIQLKFFDRYGNEMLWHPNRKARETLSERIHDVLMNWPVATYTAIRPYKGGKNKAGEPTVSERRYRT